ncbi:nucleotidyl transferase AbiEii/AbiGii toxin family protein [Mycolicibacterium goodii]|uniref:nucleotidyl transferase AbiEii/AbiGii toxin family protein n=1 Tax=Mycolicibacterium goodii TaxID=134601 RepID=UPI001BDC23B3|nr:nucleotidyl transferase AbiEii/AbiGii toxin family protein [Mycolicibacterium goodii]MBU8820328.1 nucleotidyl transferase AbiEii/AbiGii toxin family protein [Mycolicibacterium goodii]
MTAEVPVVLASTALADDNGLRALKDVSSVAGDLNYRVIGGHMIRLLRYVYDLPGMPRVTSDADTGIEEQVAIAGEFHDQLTALGYTDTSGNRYELGERAVDLLVPTGAKAGMRIFGDRAFDGAPGLRLALASPPIQLAVAARLTDGTRLDFEIPVPDIEAAFVMKMLAWTVRHSSRDVQDIETLLEIVASQPQYRASPWRMHDPSATKMGERKDAALAAARMITSPPGVVSARVRALLQRHIAAVPRP